MSKSQHDQPVLSVVLTSRENFVWHSMQEIVPWIEKTWTQARSRRHRVKIINVDQGSLGDHLPWLMRADNVILACFTYKICRYAALIRKSFDLDARYLIYLHNQATISCWPYFEWGLSEVLRESDLFLASCSRDVEALKLVFRSAQALVIPFGLLSERVRKVRFVKLKDQEIPFVFIGRISEQKNIHKILYALHLLKNKDASLKFKFHIFGAEDFFGSPNMGIKSKSYLKILKKCCYKLKLTDQVKFYGHIDRNRLSELLPKKRYIFVSASVHSDENFGMAAFRSLCEGNVAILSHWGGHGDFLRAFAKQMRTVPVRFSRCGLELNTTELFHAMRLAIRTLDKKYPSGVPSPYKKSMISKKLHKVALKKCTKKKKTLFSTPLAKQLSKKRRIHLARSGESSKIFSSYSDPNAHLFFQAYGMKGVGLN